MQAEKFPGYSGACLGSLFVLVFFVRPESSSYTHCCSIGKSLIRRGKTDPNALRQKRSQEFPDPPALLISALHSACLGGYDVCASNGSPFFEEDPQVAGSKFNLSIIVKSLSKSLTGMRMLFISNNLL